ncbi:MAG: acyl-CoA dehydrogenase [Alphaproteobacteria bacterium]|nr:acyl-CoA dehydrogenase [Alphaproteobacteria bacterium]
MRYAREVRGQNLYAIDPRLHSVLGRIDGAAHARFAPALADFGAWVGDTVDREAEYTDRFGRPTLETYDLDGATVNRVRYNPAWQAVAREAYMKGVVGLNYGPEPAPFATTFAMGYLLSQADVSLHCPVTMTGAVAYVLDRHGPPELRARYLADLVRRDGRALTGGTWATELHGGSDVGGSTTIARARNDHVRLAGLKWFVSNVDGGLALATARPEGAPPGTAGLGLYLVPMTLDDGTPNALRIRRLKDKLGTCGIATGEVDLVDAWSLEVAPPPQGFKLMMKALEISRIHNAVASVGLQRRAFLEAVSYASHRQAFGQTITAYPMLQDELLAILVELDADLVLAFEAARAFDREQQDPAETTWLRLVTALAKYRTAENANRACRSAIEIIGGNGYTYDMATPRLLRDAQVTTVWEGPANIQALEVLRLLSPRYGGFAAFTARIEAVLARLPDALAGAAQTVAGALEDCRAAVKLIAAEPTLAARHARRLMALMADTLAAALALDDAAAGLAAGDRRMAIVAELLLERHFTPAPRRGIVRDENAGHRHFEALIGYDPIV